MTDRTTRPNSVKPAGIRLKELRLRGGLTLHDVATPLGVTGACVCQWESGKHFPRREYLTKLAKVLNTSVANLIAADLFQDDGETECNRSVVTAADLIRRARQGIAAALQIDVSKVRIEIESAD